MKSITPSLPPFRFLFWRRAANSHVKRRVRIAGRAACPDIDQLVLNAQRDRKPDLFLHTISLSSRESRAQKSVFGPKSIFGVEKKIWPDKIGVPSQRRGTGPMGGSGTGYSCGQGRLRIVFPGTQFLRFQSLGDFIPKSFCRDTGDDGHRF